ncbi:unnamed protein product [Brassica rapa subsp. narinosa]
MLLRNPPSMFSDWVDLHSSLLLACSVFELQKHQEACRNSFSLSPNNMIMIVYMFFYSCSIKLYSGLKPQSTSFLTKWATEFEYELNPGISQCSSFGIGLPLNVLGSLAFWSRHQWFAMPLLRIALQAGPAAGAARGQLIFKDLSRLKRFNSEEAIEYGLIIVRPPCIKDDAPLQDESSGLG